MSARCCRPGSRPLRNALYELAITLRSSALRVNFCLDAVVVMHQVRCVPYMSMSERGEVLRAHRTRCEDGDKVHQALAASIKATKLTGRRRGNAANMDALKVSAQVSAVSFFWNYNTVESVLLFSAVLVNLAGTYGSETRVPDRIMLATWKGPGYRMACVAQ
jgi:hypothetical protein